MANETVVPVIVNMAVNTAESYFYKIVVAIVILLMGFAIGILAKKFLQRVLKEVELNKIMSNVNITYDLEWWASTIVSYLIYLSTIIIFLDQFDIKYTTILYIIMGAILALIVLSLVVGLRDVFPNFIGWMYLQKKGTMKEGHRIEIRGIVGTIEKVGYLETEIKTERGDVLYVPNSLFLRSKHQLQR